MQFNNLVCTAFWSSHIAQILKDIITIIIVTAHFYISIKNAPRMCTDFLLVKFLCHSGLSNFSPTKYFVISKLKLTFLHKL